MHPRISVQTTWNGLWAQRGLAAMVGIALAAGLLLGSVAWRSMRFDRPMPEEPAADPAVAMAFYTTLDRVLRGEDEVDWDELVSDDFVDHESGQAEPRSMDELVTQLRAFGTTFPGTRFAVDHVAAVGGRLIVSMAPLALTTGQVAGLTVAPVPVAGGIDVLAVRRGRISERWARALPAVTATTRADAAITVDEADAQYANLYRIELPPGGELEWITPKVAIVMVDAGTLSLSVEPKDALEQLERFDIDAGSARRLPAVSHIRLRGNEEQTTRLLLFDAAPATSGTLWPFKRFGGTTSALLWASKDPLAVSAPWTVQIGMVSIPAERSIELRNPDLLGMVLTTTGMPAGLTFGAGTLTHLDENYHMATLASPGTIAGGTTAELSGADSLAIDAAGQVGCELWVITFGPPGTPIAPEDPPDSPPGRPGRRR